MSERLQFCRGDDDISSDFHAESDADEVRVWSDDGVAVAVSRNSSGRWSYAASDFGADADWDLDRSFDSWQEALEAFGFSALVR
ncbi:hypothetical protein [Mycolicibacterium aubagnense]|uniref:Uncharacterized protein n=1 Tax=Mycolicibacterium aubagnense TaxID=319707 RepID=A0ABN5Z4P3_9MYCO|nr:hypothetical protein [Mycolicibacterium aubagnense]BBX87969.1 hypothetical protein MAUB_58420 [Mycolicibacterium aubagnense]